MDDVTTAVFIEQVGDWYEVMNNNKIELCFSKHKPQAHEECLQWLEHFMYFFSSTKMHSSQQQDSLKPTQKGVLMTTKSIVTLQKTLLDNGFDFVLSSRFSNDCIGKKHIQQKYYLFTLINTSCFWKKY